MEPTTKQPQKEPLKSSTNNSKNLLKKDKKKTLKSNETIIEYKNGYKIIGTVVYPDFKVD